MTRTLKDSFVSGLAWSSVSRIGTHALQFAVTFILARLLSPTEFGLVGLANIFLLLATQLNNFGISAAIIQRVDLDEEHLSTSFWMNIIMGLTLTVVIYCLAQPASKFFKNEELTHVMRVLSVIFLIGSLRVVQNALFSKKLQFKILAMIEVIPLFLSGIASIIMAYAGWKVWALVYGRIIYITSGVFLAWFYSSWAPKLKFKFKKFKELFSFGWNVMATNVVGYTGGSLTLAVSGRLLDVTSVGLYSMATRIISIPSRRMTQGIVQVMFPVFSKIQTDEIRFKNAYFKILKIIALVTFPSLTVVACLSEEFVHVILGDQWTAIIPLLKILSFMGMIGAITSTVGSIYCSKGRPDIELKIDIFLIAVFLPVLIFMSRWGLIGVVWAVVWQHCVMITVYFWGLKPLLKFNFSDILKSFYSAVQVSLVIYAFSVFFRMFYYFYFENQLIFLSGALMLSGLIYLLFFRLFNYDLFMELKTLVIKKLQQKNLKAKL